MKTPVNSQTSGDSRFFTLKPRRKLRNRIQKPGLQLRFPLYTILLTVFFAGSIVATVYLSFGDLYNSILNVSELGEYYKNAIRENFQASIGLLTMFFLAYITLIVVLSVVVTHRMIGPTYSFVRQIRALKNGDYYARIVLRKHDEFKDVAKELNELAEILECKSFSEQKDEQK